MDMDTSAPLSCAGLTAYGAVKNSGLKPDNNVVVVGTGGHFKLDQATEALTMLTKGKIIGRGVINP